MTIPTVDPEERIDRMTRQAITFESSCEEDTDRLGQMLARVLPGGTTVALEGTLGAGKTRLVQAIATGCQVPAHQVTSPTFVLCQHYAGNRPLHHFDAYRLSDLDEFLELGPEEYFDSPGITFVEWADRVAAGLPDDRLVIGIEVVGAQARRFKILATGPRGGETLQRLQQLLGESPPPRGSSGHPL